ncbi:MAG: class I SAM-dependent methyltransferase, partial [Pyrinomonadaceae bacterium]
MMDGQERFTEGAGRYADYLQTTEGRLRLDLAWANLCDALREAGAGDKRRALDLGGGTGALSIRLAAGGWDVTLLDSSEEMLWLAREAARRAGYFERISFRQADAASIAGFFPPASFDLIICHNVLEYVADPRAVVAAVGAVADRHGLVSLLARNRAGEVLRAALKGHDLSLARHALHAEFVTESLYGGPARLFDPAALRALAADAALAAVAERGVRVLVDYLPTSMKEG